MKSRKNEMKEVEGCMKCGSKDLDPLPGGAYFGATAVGLSTMSGKMLCNKCGYYGIPLIFKSESDREKYAKRKEKTAK